MLWCEALYGSLAHSAETSTRIVELFPAHTHSTPHTVSSLLCSRVAARLLNVARVCASCRNPYLRYTAAARHTFAGLRACDGVRGCLSARSGGGASVLVLCLYAICGQHIAAYTLLTFEM